MHARVRERYRRRVGIWDPFLAAAELEGRWLLHDRNARLETRQLGIGTHLIV